MKVKFILLSVLFITFLFNANEVFAETYGNFEYQIINENEVEILWSTSDSQVATVEDGVVTPVSVGVAIITAKCGDFTASCEINVIDKMYTTLENEIVTVEEEKVTILSIDEKTSIENLLTAEKFPLLNEHFVKILDGDGKEKSTTEKVGSRDIIKIVDEEGNVLEEYTAIVSGDISGDGNTKMYDSFQILKDSIISGKTLDAIDIKIRDFNNDGFVRMYDAFQFLKAAILG